MSGRWLPRRRFRPGSSSRRPIRRAARKLCQSLEPLEDRTLLSPAQVVVDPTSYAPSDILVRFRSEPVAASAVPAGMKLDRAFAIVPGLREVKLDPSMTVTTAIAALNKNPQVLYAEPDYIVHATQIPNDPQFGTQWDMNNTGQSGGTPGDDIGAPAAWNVTTGSSNTLVAVIDTGVDYNHPDLAANIWTNPGEIPGNGIDDDHNGFVDDVHGYNFVNNTGDPMDDNNHGTHVAGTIGAVGNNGVGVAGINWSVKIMAVKFLDSTGSGTSSNAIAAINYAVANGATISNNSWGGDPFDQALFNAIQAAQAAGQIFVAAAGNGNSAGIGQNNDTTPFYPAGYNLDNVVAVAATDRNDNLATFSNYGATTVDLGAPGVGILSTTRNNTYSTFDGTSMATPHVTGVMALVKSLHPTWSYSQVINQVLSTTDPIPSLQGKTVTGGRLDAARAVGAPDVTGPRVILQSPTGVVTGSMSSVRLSFSEPIAPTSFDSSDILSFQGPGGSIAVTSVTPVAGTNGEQFDVAFPAQSVHGVYTMTVGPQITDLAGNPMDQNRNGINGEVPQDEYSAQFSIGDIYQFNATDVPGPITGFNTTISTLTIAQDVRIADLNVQLGLTYPTVGDLQISLISPEGTQVVLSQFEGGDGANFTNTTFDDEAPLPISAGTAPFSGSFQPDQPLSALDGQNTSGTWQLEVEDFGFFSGSLDSWSLIVQPDLTPPPVSINDVAVVEGNSGTSNAVFTVALGYSSNQVVTVDYATADGTTNPATAGIDYIAQAGTLTFNPGVTTQTIAVPVIGDTQDEPDETFFVNLTNPVNATIADGQGVGTIRNDETSLSVNDVAVQEGDSGTTAAVFTISLANPSAQTISVQYATADGTATAGKDYTATSGTLTFAPGELAKTVSVPVIGDTLNEANETFTVNLVQSTNAIIADSQGVGTILDDDPVPFLTINNSAATEGNSGTKNFSFLVTLNAASGQTITVPYATADGTATAGSDYTATSGTLVFSPGQTVKAINVPVIGDTAPEPDETFTVNLGTPTNARLFDGQPVGTILNDEASVTVGDISIAEGDSGPTTGLMPVTLSSAMPFPVSVNYVTYGGTATAGADFVPASGTVTFAAGETSKSIPLLVLGDTLNEGNETFTVFFSGASNAQLSRTQAVGTIVDDDPLPSLSVNDVAVTEGNAGTKTLTFTVSLSAASGRNVTVNYATADGTASAGSDYVAKSGTITFFPGSTTQTVAVTINGDTLPEGDETFTLNLSNPANATLARSQGVGTIQDDDLISISDISIPEGDSGTRDAVFTLQLASAQAQPVSVNYATANGTATAGSDYVATSGTLTFAPGETSKPIHVLELGDTRNEGNETFTMNLSGAVGAVMSPLQAVATIVDDDPVPTITVNDVTVAEGNTGTKNMTFTLTLSAPSGRSVSVSYATADGTATAGSDYVAAKGTLYFFSGSATQTLTVTVNGDTTVEPDETLFLNLSNPVGATLNRAQATGKIANDDPAPLVTIANASTTEGNSFTKNMSFFVTLSGASSQTITVPYSTSDGTATAGSDYTATSGTLTFSPGQTFNSINVPIIGDTTPEPDETLNVTLGTPTNAGVLVGQTVGTILNDDASITIGDISQTEGDTGLVTALAPVTLSSPMPFPVSVNYTLNSGTATAGADFVAGSGTVTFGPGETSKSIPVSILGDRLNEGNETFTVSLANSTNAVISRSNAVVTIFDDDSLPTLAVNDVAVAEGNSGTKTLTFTVSLSAPSGRTVSVSYATADSTATAGSDYVAKSGTLSFIPGSTTQTVSVTINGDTTPEQDETFFLNLTSPVNATLARGQGVGTILDDDNLTINDISVVEGNSGTVNAVFTLQLNRALTVPVTVSYATANGTALAGSDYVATSGTVSFAPGETSKAVTVLEMGDTRNEGNEMFTLNLTGATNVLIGKSQGVATIVDDDPLPAFSVTDAAVIEGNTGTKTLTFTVSLNAVSGRTVSVAYATADGTATAGSDYVAAGGTLTFAPGSTSQPVSVTINGDRLVEGDETLFLNLSSAVNATLADGQGVGTILDDDVASGAGSAGFSSGSGGSGGVSATSTSLGGSSAGSSVLQPLTGPAANSLRDAALGSFNTSAHLDNLAEALARDVLVTLVPTDSQRSTAWRSD